MDLAVDLEFWNTFVAQVFRVGRWCRHLVRRSVGVPSADFSRDQLQKADSHFDARELPFDETFRLQPAGVARLLVLGPCPRQEDPEIEPLPILNGRGAVRIEDETLIENRIRDLFGQLQIHDSLCPLLPAEIGLEASGPSDINSSIARSHVGIPRLRLKAASFSNASRSRQSHAVLG